MTQKQLAEYLGVHQTTYSDYELGRLNIPLRTLCSIADFYGVSTDYLLRRTSNPEPYERSFLANRPINMIKAICI